MKVSTFVDLGSQEIEVDIGFEVVSAALSEAFAVATRPDGDDRATVRDVARALNNIAVFFGALTDEHIARLSPQVRKVVHAFMTTHAERFADRA